MLILSIWLLMQISKSRNTTQRLPVGGGGGNGPKNGSLKAEIEVFSGFKPAVEACYLSWDDYTIPGVTYSHDSHLYHCPFTCFRHAGDHLHQVNASSSVLNCTSHHNPHHHHPGKKRAAPTDNR